MPLIDLGPAPEDRLVPPTQPAPPDQDAQLVDLGPAPGPTTFGSIAGAMGMSFAPGEPSTKQVFIDQAVGSLAKGAMRLGEAAVAIPENAVRFAKTLNEIRKKEIESGNMGSWGIAGMYTAAKQFREDPEATARVEKGLTAELKNITNMHRRGQEAILKAHPEWEYDPPENFIDLVTNPRKLVLSLLESTPLLVAAGIVTAAGQPALSASMMFTTEFQDMKNMALADGCTEQEAQAAGLLYAPIAAAIEQMQLHQIMTVAKGMHKPLTRLVAKKLAAKGILRPSYPVLKTMINEAIEEMSQTGWQEATAKLVYGKPITGGLRGFIDRQLQSAYLGGAMAIIPGVGGKVVRRAAKATKAPVKGIIRKALMPIEEKVKMVPIDRLPIRGVGMPTEEYAVRAKSIKEEGIKEPILIDKDTGQVLDGVRRLDIARDLGIKEIPVRYIDPAKFSAEEIRAGLKPLTPTSKIESPPLIVKEPTTADQAIGQQYGLTNEQTDERLANAEHRYHELKLKDVAERTLDEQKELAFLRRNRNNIESLLDRETQPEMPKIVKRTKSNLRAIAHKIQREAGVSDEDYRDMAEIVTGKRSMKHMTRKEMDEFTSAMEEAYGTPSELNIKDFEAPILVNGRETTMGAVHTDAIETVDNLTAKREIPSTVKMGFGKTGTAGRLKSFFFGIDNTPVYHLARILDGGTEGIFSEVLDKNIQAGQKVARSHLRFTFDSIANALVEAGVTADDLAKISRSTNPRTRLHQWLSTKAATETLNENFNGQNFELTWANLIDIYLMSNQDSGMRHLLNGGLVINTVETGGLTNERIMELRQKVEDNPKVLAVIDAIMDVEARLWKPMINEVSNKLEGKDIATVPDWWGHEVYNPKRLVGKERPGIPRTHKVNLMEDKSILHDRTRSKAPLVVRDALNRFSVFESAIAEYVGMAEPTRTSRTLLNDPIISNMLMRKGYGKVKDHIAEIHRQAQSISASEGSFTAFFAQYLPGLYRAVLYFNPRVVASQFTSVLNYGAYVSPEFIKSVKDGLNISNAQETLKLSDFAWERFNMGHSSLELGEMAKNDAALKLWAGKASDVNKLGWTLKVADLAALTSGMSIAQQEYAKAQKGELEGLSAEWWLNKDNLPEADVEMWRRVEELGDEADPLEVEAVEVWKKTVTERAEYLWQRTQPSWDKWNRSLLTTQKGARRLFLLFRSFHEKSLTIFNEAKLDYEHSSKTLEDKARFAQRTGSVMASYTLNMALRLAILAITTRKFKEPLHYLQDFLTSWMAMFPVFDKVLDAASRKFIAEATSTTAEYRGEPLGSFPIKMVNIALKAPTDFAGAAGNFIAGDSDATIEDLERGVKKIYEGVGALYGIPVYEPKRFFPEKDEETTTGRRQQSGQRHTRRSYSRRRKS